MKRHKSRWLTGLCVAWVVALLPSYGWAGLKLGLARVPGNGLANLAQAQGFFAAEGLDLDIIPCYSGGDCVARMLKGEYQVTLAADTGVVVATQEGRKIDVIATTSTSRTSNRMVVRKSSEVTTPQQLRGKRVGYLAGSSSHYFAEAFLNYHGVDARDVKMVPLDPRRSVEQLLAGEVDAAGLFYPNAPIALERLGDNGFAFPTPPIYTVSVNLVSAPEVSDADLERMLRALLRAENFLKTQPAQAREALVRQLGLDAALVDSMLREFDFRLTLNQSLLVTLEAQARWSKRSTLVDNRVEVDYFERMRPGPLRRIDARRVTLVK